MDFVIFGGPMHLGLVKDWQIPYQKDNKGRSPKVVDQLRDQIWTELRYTLIQSYKNYEVLRFNNPMNHYHINIYI